MSGITNIIERIVDNVRATLDVAMTDGDTQRIDCILKKTDLPASVKLFYPPDTIRTNQVKQGSKCRLIIRHGEGAVNLEIQIDKVHSDNALTCTALKSIKPEKLREYFRVMINIPIRAHFRPDPKDKKNPQWQLTGNTIDLSGGGVLALFPGKPQSNNRIKLEIKIPGQKTPVLCHAKIIRIYRMRKKRYQVAFFFESIEHKYRDMLVACCMQEQRQQLREKVRV